MIGLAKWALAITTVILLIWITFGQQSLTGTPTPESKVIDPAAQQDAELQLSTGMALWENAQYQQASQVFLSLGEKTLQPKLQSLVALYRDHSRAFLENQQSDIFQQLPTLSESCKQKILFVTPELSSLAQAEHFRMRFAQDMRLKSLPICIYATTWFDPLQINCQENWQQSGRLGCELLSLAEKLKPLAFTHLVIFADKGKANVHNGIMFLDRHDTYDVFIHELAHFSGFIDEYPLNQELAKRVCAGVDAPNLVFQRAKQHSTDQGYWQSIGIKDEQSLYAARTCDNHSTQAFKASNKLTFMEYHDTAFIPSQYLKAWQLQLQDKPNQPSAHVNFAQLYEQSNNSLESQFWRAKYQQYRATSAHRSINL